jgi:hypothetical protein
MKSYQLKLKARDENENGLFDNPDEDCFYSDFSDLNNGCSHSVYGDLYEILPTRIHHHHLVSM